MWDQNETALSTPAKINFPTSHDHSHHNHNTPAKRNIFIAKIIFVCALVFGVCVVYQSVLLAIGQEYTKFKNKAGAKRKQE